MLITQSSEKNEGGAPLSENNHKYKSQSDDLLISASVTSTKMLNSNK